MSGVYNGAGVAGRHITTPHPPSTLGIVTTWSRDGFKDGLKIVTQDFSLSWKMFYNMILQPGCITILYCLNSVSIMICKSFHSLRRSWVDLTRSRMAHCKVP